MELGIRPPKLLLFRDRPSRFGSLISDGRWPDKLLNCMSRYVKVEMLKMPYGTGPVKLLFPMTIFSLRLLISSGKVPATTH